MKTTRVLICDRRTGSYLRAPEAWTTQLEAAYDFIRVVDALRFAHRWGLANIELLLDFEYSQYNVRVPVGGAAQAA